VTAGTVAAPSAHDAELAPVRHTTWRRLRRKPGFWLGGGGVVLLVFAAVFAPVISAHDPLSSYRDIGLTAGGDPVAPGGPFVMGTDQLGRDYFARLLYGARVSLSVGIGANLVAVFIGVMVGATAAYAGSPVVRLGLGRWRLDLKLPVESLLMRTTDVLLAFPVLLLAIALVAIVGASFWLVLIVIAAFLWTATARVVYGQVLSIKEREFVDAARAVGVSPWRVLRRHILPHVWPVVIVYAALGISGAILFESALSYLGVGVPPPAPSWGLMISEHITYYATDPRLILLPGLAILLTILSFNLLGDALRDALDPYHRH
jgi:peptide/nickel transport system permease protein